jgi:two-component system cell cycle response regulator CpdR
MSPKLIMLVEDDVNLRQSVALILQRAGYLITTTDCVTKAIPIIQSGSYHLLITDINMPDTRNTLIPEVLAMHPSLSIVILSDQSASENEKEYRLLSAHYLHKPIASEQLLDCVGTILGKNGNSKHN